MGPISRVGTGTSARQSIWNSTEIAAANRQSDGCSTASQCTFLDTFKYRDTTRWWWADKYANGNPFDCWWSKSKVWYAAETRRMKIGIAKVSRFGKQYVSGQQQSTKWHGYGCYEVRMKPVKQKGLVTAFFGYTGRYDTAPGFPKSHQEIDIEFVWRENVGEYVMQCNYFVQGRGGNEHHVVLPFNPWRDFHNYAFRWTQYKIEWYADGRLVHTASRNIPKIWNGPLKIMMNFWPVNDKGSPWAGVFRWMGPRVAQYEGVRFTKGSWCTIQNSFPEPERD